MVDTIAEAWTDGKDTRLVEMWQEIPCPYVTNSPEYYDRAKRLAAVAAMALELSLSGTLYVYRPK